ncbi:transmembrane protein, putative (macronuclear) [Tetrahymena thermophila SB210]|uniref:Transmembrane protein, putative n=1 Tax=Tetrahymena thermophila (strain SB210) TaxID=312017 RepID=I7LT07_TETTS|nr:transmembrane protein, putative [Tetrahymena thermophila SB210]EAR84021.2 transmembrane protein, putative [Tetrahymena thermophila SB210]|eukprot:XP_001031684.2 transmembrane protein, putative [Tetrahymena thermophila SB210]
MKLIVISVIPVVLIFFVAISSLQIALSYTKQYINEYGQNIFQNQIKFSSSTESIISFRLSREIYKIPVYISMLNSLHEKMTQGEVIMSHLYRPSTVNQMLLYQQKLTPDLTKLAFKNRMYVNSWYQQNATQINQLDKLGQEILYNLTRLIPFLNTIQYQSRLNISNVITIPYQQVNIFTSQEGIVLTNFANSSLSSKLDSNTCYQGKFIYDPRCRFFYLNSLNHTSIFMNPPKVSLAATPSYLSQYTCQMAKRYNQQTKNIENSHIQCIEAMLSNIYDYFQNIIQSSKQYYVIDPRTLSIFFNSKNKYNFANMTQADNFYSAELQYLQEQDQAQYIQKFINDTYSQWIFSKEKNSYVNVLQMLNLSQQAVVKDYTRNGTTYKIIFNPVIQYDQIPKVVTKYTNEEGLQLQYAYLQINIISDEDLKTFTNQLLSFFSNMFVGVQITLATISIIFLIVAIYYAIQIQKLITLPIIRMKETLEEINQLKELVDISEIIKEYEQKADIIFLSQETYLLYQSFLDMFEMIQYTSESFFFENEGKTLISLSKKVEFFTKFQNYSAAGVTHNNIGNILLNQEHFFQALEHFSLAIMFAKYELSTYYQNNPYSLYANLLYEYSYIEYINYQTEPQEQSSRNISISQKIIHNKTSFSKSRQLSKEKRVSNDIQELNTQGQIMRNISISQKPTTTKTHFSKSRKITQDKKQIYENIQEQNLTKTQQTSKLKRPSKYFLNQQNAKSSEQILRQTEDKNQIQELILNLFYRQQNYIVTLMAFQESLNSSSSKLNNQNSFNFWKEIKHLLNEQLKLIDYFPEIQYLKVFMNCLISKCYYNQFKYEKTKKKFKEAEIVLINLEKIQEQREKELPNLTENATLQKEIAFDFRKQAQSKYFNELEHQQQQQDTSKKLFFPIMKMRQNQISTPSHYKLDTSDIINNTSINMQVIYNQNQESQNSFETQNKILTRSKSINQDILKRRITSTKNASEQKLLINQSQFLDKIIQNQQNKLLELTQSNNLTNSRMTLQTLKQYFQFSRSEYFIFIKKYKKAAEILTELYESSQNMTSNIPFRIVYKIKHIFDAHKIQDLTLLEEYSRFNKNISLQVVVSLEYITTQNNRLSNQFNLFKIQNQSQQQIKIGNDFKKEFSECQIQLLLGLSMSVLTKDSDKICLVTIDQEEKSITQILELIDIKLFREVQDNVYDKLNIQSFKNQNLQSIQNQDYILDRSRYTQFNSQCCKEMIDSEITEDVQIFEEYFNKSQQKLKSNQKRFLISDLNTVVLILIVKIIVS